jgi:hypothetical protein
MTGLQLTLEDIDRSQARRYGRLAGIPLGIATAGIIRHLKACERYGMDPDIGAIREIIDDAQDGRAVYQEKTP